MSLRGIILFLALSLPLPGIACAAIITPPGLMPGDQFRIAFLTDGTTAATAFDLAFYDSFVTTEATNAGFAPTLPAPSRGRRSSAPIR